MDRTPDRRHSRLVNRKFQLGLAWRLVVACLVFFYLGIVLIFTPSMLRLAMNTTDLSVQESAANELLLLHARVWPAILLSFGGVFLYTLVLSHRIAGPVHRINETLRKMIEGRNPESVSFRKNDYFQPTADLLTALSHKLFGRSEKKADGTRPSGDDPGR